MPQLLKVCTCLIITGLLPPASALLSGVFLSLSLPRRFYNGRHVRKSIDEAQKYRETETKYGMKWMMRWVIEWFFCCHAQAIQPQIALQISPLLHVRKYFLSPAIPLLYWVECVGFLGCWDWRTNREQGGPAAWYIPLRASLSSCHSPYFSVTYYRGGGQRGGIITTLTPITGLREGEDTERKTEKIEGC